MKPETQNLKQIKKAPPLEGLGRIKSPFGGLGAVREAFCPIKSRLKMLIFTKAGYDNQTWYSFLKKYKKDWDKEAHQMLERAKKHYKNIGQTIIIYDNQTKQEMLKYNF